MSVVQLNQVKKYFDGVAAIKELSLTIEEGEVLGLFGHNGAGKTTTMKLILGLLAPTEGTVSVFGQPPASAHFSDYRYKLGFLPENVSFYQQLTGKEVLSYFAKLKKVNKNHLNGVHACGLATCAEFCSGLLLLYKLGFKNYRLIMESLEIKFHYQAKSDVTAKFELTNEMVSEIKSALENEGVTYKKCEVKLHDKEQNHVATCTTNWQIKDWKKVKTKV